MHYEKTNPILLSAIPVLKEYSLATGTQMNIIDSNYMPIAELLNKDFSEKNICYNCVKQQNIRPARRCL